METTAHFEHIPQEIARRLAAATQEIVVAVAWFTDPILFDALCKQAGRGLRVRLAVLNDRINCGPGRLNFQRLQDCGGDLFLIPAGGDRDPIMHHKFCVIDRATVIIGSYNWTRRAQDNDESITVIADGPDIAADYLNAFDALLSKHGQSTPAIDQAQLRRRLEIVRNLLLLEEWDGLSPQLDKLRPAGTALQLEPLFTALQARDTATALAWIDDYLKRATALTIAGDQEVADLRLTLRGLEYQVTALSDDKAELERLIHAFSLRSSHEIGDLITRYLGLRADKLRRQAAVEPEAAPDADNARADYEDYRDANETARATPAPPQLPPDDLKELKRLYQQASQKCHPDKVDEADRDHANRLFVQLQAAYRNNDLAGVRAIHAAVREGHLFVDRAMTLTEAESLGHAIAVLRRDLERLAAEVHQLRRSEAYRTLKDLDDWDVYFAEQRVVLERAIEQLEAELA
ncbi:phospholipase D-like domain-containing protein [uncultured Thiodictyon sp.]|uniref:phospholipase D-like domain-containing protein n=1 Tax=uncultured Thiodictyon sp. TaxID=1846217 RepID=UPI0025D33449|nr:phospholipase D-like domain-containing protein [uncultured Thiodictyon sp.]